MEGNEKHLICFGLGYTASVLARQLKHEGWRITGTHRVGGGRPKPVAVDVPVLSFDRDHPNAAVNDGMATSTHVLVSVPPDDKGDAVFDLLTETFAAAERLSWLGYLSTTGVYGDTGGAVVSETAALRPSVERSRRRVAAEAAWLSLHARFGLPVHVFRLAGIYGPGRSALDQVRSGQTRRIHRPGQVFARIHVEDIATILRASMKRPRPGAIYNVCDDEAASQSDVMGYACGLLGVVPPPPASLEEAASEMSAMALSFWKDNRRIDNRLIKDELGVRLIYPTYREGLLAILAAEQHQKGQNS